MIRDSGFKNIYIVGVSNKLKEMYLWEDYA